MTQDELLEIIEKAEREKWTELDLGWKDLKELPPEFAKLNNLTTLNLAGNQLTQIPPGFAKLNNLTKLNLRKNQFRQLPPEIAKLNNLTILDLRNNQLTQLPLDFAKLNNLKELGLRDNELTQLPPNFAKLNNLEELGLRNNQLTQLPPNFAKLNKLRKIDLSDNELTQLPPDFAKLNNLIQLDFDYDKLNIPDEMRSKPAQELIQYILQRQGDLPEKISQANGTRLEINIKLPKNKANSTMTVFLDENYPDYPREGTYGIVYKASDEEGNPLAVKFLKISVPKEENDRNVEKLENHIKFLAKKKSFKKERKATQKLEDKFGYVENIGQTLFYGRSKWQGEEKVCLVSEFIEGPELREYIQSGINNEIKMELLIMIAKGLKYIHGAKIVHRDLSSRNIMVTNEGIAKIIDFGISFFAELTQSTYSLTLGERDGKHYARRGRGRGNIPYMAPEQWKPAKYIGECGLKEIEPNVYQPIPQMDIWAFGIIAHEIFADGSRPFQGGDEAIRLAVLQDPLECNTKIPDEIKNIIEFCLKKHPKDRKNIKEILNLLESTTIWFKYEKNIYKHFILLKEKYISDKNWHEHCLLEITKKYHLSKECLEKIIEKNKKYENFNKAIEAGLNRPIYKVTMPEEIRKQIEKMQYDSQKNK